MDLNIYLIDFKHFPSAPECTVVLASSEAEALEMVGKCDRERIDGIELVSTDTPKEIYTGNFCC